MLATVCATTHATQAPALGGSRGGGEGARYGIEVGAGRDMRKVPVGGDEQ